MLKITIPSIELYDEIKCEFIFSKEQTLQLEHSLVSLSKWESKWEKPFLTADTKTVEETMDYIRCMTITQNVSDDTYKLITTGNIKEVNAYIEAPMSATVFSKSNKKINKEVITAEIIYYWMIIMAIPFDCQKWHLNRLLTLINVWNIKNQPEKKMNRKELINRNRELNMARRNEANTKG